MEDLGGRHGGLKLLVVSLTSATAVAAAEPPADHLLPRVRSQSVELGYEINDEARPLLAVELWYTFDLGQTWHNYGRDDDSTPPMSFSAPQEGLCGVYFVARNATGSSGPTPSFETQPQFWMFVDYTPPVGQLHPPQIERRGGGRLFARLSWTAIDANLTSRPIDLAYRVPPDGAWMDLTRRLPNSGRYDWSVPDEIRGDVMFRLTIRDRGGHEVHCAAAAIRIDPSEQGAGDPADARTTGQYASVDANHAPTPLELKRALELLRKGNWHQLRGEHELAAARFTDALSLHPEQPDTLVKLGTAMYALGRYADSAGAFELALQQRPGHRDTLEGLARTLVAAEKYAAAESRLLAIVEQDAEDVEAWLHLGDVAIYLGDEIAAREYYYKAATLQPDANSVVARAKARLEDLPSLSGRNRR